MDYINKPVVIDGSGGLECLWFVGWLFTAPVGLTLAETSRF